MEIYRLIYGVSGLVMTHRLLRYSIAASGIQKHIAYCCSHHTFAILQLAASTDIYTDSKMLTRKNAPQPNSIATD